MSGISSVNNRNCAAVSGEVIFWYIVWSYWDPDVVYVCHGAGVVGQRQRMQNISQLFLWILTLSLLM